MLGLLHEELHAPGPLGALGSLAQIEVSLRGTMGQASAHILYRKPGHRPTYQVRKSPRRLEVRVRETSGMMGRTIKEQAI